jgi:membrane-associated phospholipid phosphatase
MGESFMDSILHWGIQPILWLQHFSPALDLPFIGLTQLGSEEFFMLAVAVVFWCLNRRHGARLAMLLLFSVWLNSVAKELLNQPRPFSYDPAVRMIFPADGGGMPSGHTQNTVVLWGYLAWAFRRRWLTVLAALFIVLVPLSRLYLGVHFPTDLLGGYLLGGVLLWLYVRWEPAAENWVHRRRLGWQFAVAFVVPLVLYLVHPSADEALVTGLATFTGMGLAFVHERRWVGFEAPAGTWQRLACLVLGIAMALIIRFGLKAAFTGMEPEAAFRFARYVLIGLWAGVGAPWTFVRLGWAPAPGRV